MDFTEFELRQKLQETELKLYTATQRISTLLHENATLKQTIETMAMQESQKKTRFSQQVLARWQYYHKCKQEIKAVNKITDWREVKWLSDLQFRNKNDIKTIDT